MVKIGIWSNLELGRTKLEYNFDGLENLEKSNNKKTREVTDYGEAIHVSLRG
jgi:hypothetical protein